MYADFVFGVNVPEGYEKVGFSRIADSSVGACVPSSWNVRHSPSHVALTLRNTTNAVQNTTLAVDVLCIRSGL